MDIHSGATPRGHVDAEDRVSAAYPAAAARESNSRDAPNVMVGGRRSQVLVVFFSSVHRKTNASALPTLAKPTLAKPSQGLDRIRFME